MVAAACLGCFLLTLVVVLAAGYWTWLRQPLATLTAGEWPALETRGPAALSHLRHAIERIGAAMPVGRARRCLARQKLVSAGYREPSCVPLYFGLKCCLALAVPGVLCPLLFAIRPDVFAVAFAGSLAAYCAFRLPSWVVGFAASSRQQAIREALPDLIDLLVIGVESGLSIDQAIAEADRTLGAIHTELSEELYLFRLEMNAGTTRAEALRNLGRRTGEPHMRKFGSLLIQTERFGTGIARVLRVQARFMRLRRRQRAEELAHQLAVKMVFPIFFLILPSTFLVTAGPAMLYLFGDLRRILAE